jgi:hypothetical protein
MTKTNGAKRKRPTHFEQIPLEVVKKVAARDVPRNDNAARDEASTVPTPTKITAQRVPRRTSHRKDR